MASPQRRPAARELNDIHLAAPEPLDWLDVEGFRFTTQSGDDLQHDPKVSTYLDSREPSELTAEVLKRNHMEAIRHDGQPQRSWQISRCLVYQTELDGELYVLSAGDWFRVSLTFKDRVYEEDQRLPILDGLPEADPGTDEDAYNLSGDRHRRSMPG